MVRVTIKWGKEKYEDIEIDTTAGAAAFKEQLYQLTGVPVERQKVMAKKAWPGMLKDDADLSGVGLTEGHVVTLIGSSTGIPKPPAKAAVFIEDLAPEDVLKAGKRIPPGLQNLGNTCYMNSTLQCIKAVPELADAVKSSPTEPLSRQLASLFSELERSHDAVAPGGFWMTLQSMFPQFAERSAAGYKQQDSDEFQGALMNTLADGLKSAPPSVVFPPGVDNVVDALFGVDIEVRLHCQETDDEEDVIQHETHRKVVCNIAGGAGSTVQINHIHEGIKLGLDGTLEKNSTVLGRNAVWTREQRVARLPKYLCVQFMRFFWKSTPDSRDHAGVKCKMMRPIAFPADNLDVYDLCTTEVQKKLKVWRDKHAEDSLSETRTGGGGGGGEGGGGDEASKDAAEAMEVDDPDLAAAIAMSKVSDADTTVGANLPPQFRGMYELYAVVTHKGRNADSGHYMGWVRQSGDDWLCYDDDEVSECKTEDITRLKGGGDYHMAYIVFYRAKE